MTRWQNLLRGFPGLALPPGHLPDFGLYPGPWLPGGHLTAFPLHGPLDLHYSPSGTTWKSDMMVILGLYSLILLMRIRILARRSRGTGFFGTLSDVLNFQADFHGFQTPWGGYANSDSVTVLRAWTHVILLRLSCFHYTLSRHVIL